jgi:hypothetical protein
MHATTQAYIFQALFHHEVIVITPTLNHRIKISNRRETQRCNMSSVFYAKICSLLARRRSSQPVQRVYWPVNVIDWLGKWRPTCVMRHARGQKLQSFRRTWPFYMDLYSMTERKLELPRHVSHGNTIIVFLIFCTNREKIDEI